MNFIARIHTDFPEKFGIPRQSRLIEEAPGEIVFEPPYRHADAVRGLETFSHIWLIWQFSANLRDRWSPVVRPPRLGGNRTMGVFATRSSFRPNAVGLSAVRLDHFSQTAQGPVLHVLGADLMDGTPIFDIKPYIPYADCIPEASAGYTEHLAEPELHVEFPETWLQQIPADKRAIVLRMLSLDPRPAYQSSDNKAYGLAFAGFNIRFSVESDTLHVLSVSPIAR